MQGTFLWAKGNSKSGTNSAVQELTIQKGYKTWAYIFTKI